MPKAQKIERKVGERVTLNLTFDASKTKALADGILEAIITTNSVDRYNEVIATEGIDTTAYLNNPVVLYGHDYSMLPIGKTLKLTQMKNKIKAQFQLAVNEFPFAQTVYALVQAGYLNAVSIGGRVREWSEDYKTILQMEMVEFSIVAVPANPEALITSKSFEEATGKTIETVRMEFEQMNKQLMVDKFRGMPEDELNDAIKGLELALARLKESASAPPSQHDKPQSTTKRFILKDAQAVAEQSHRVIRTIKLSK